MPNLTGVQQVRELVIETLRELHIPAGAGVEETILIRNGFYCGRRFATNGAHAIWFCEENQLKFYGDDGQLLRVLSQLDRRACPAGQPLADAA